MTTAIEQLIKRYFEEVWNQGKLDVLDEIMSPDYVNHSPGAPNPLPGPEGLKPIVAAIREGFPDLHYEIINMVVTDKQVAVHTIMRGTNIGELFGMPATGKAVEVAQMQIERIVNNQLSEHWRVTDELTMMKQLGKIDS
tara:strand:+ start:130651 stop:131067 length:417 start_codon:yes stop_codon:yes gene_type:complete